MPPPTNLYQQLKDALQEFKDFLDENVPIIQPAIAALGAMIPQIEQLLDQLIELMGDLKEEINNLDVGAIPGLAEVSQFTAGIKTLLETSRNLLPQQAGTINDVLAVVDVVGSLPSLDDVKGEINTLIDAIVVHLNSLKG
jgi:ABC-type transporter Mla subunit MlaD